MLKPIHLFLVVSLFGSQGASCIEVSFVGTSSLQAMGIPIDPGSSENNATDIIVSGTTAYLTTFHSVEVLDMGDIQNPHRLSSVILPGSIGYSNRRMVKAGNLLFVCMFGEDVAVLNVEDRSAPFLASTIQTEGEARDIDVGGHIAYIAGGPSGLLAVDIISPSSPVTLAQITDYGGASGLRIIDDYLFVSFNKTPYQFAVFSVTADIPVFINSIPLTFIAGKIEFIPASTLFTESRRFVDISNPETPMLREDRIYALDWGLEDKDFMTDEHYIYYTGSASVPDDLYLDGFFVLDAVNPTHERVGQWYRFDSLQFPRMDRRDNLFFLAEGSWGLTILKVEEDSEVKDTHWCLYQ